MSEAPSWRDVCVAAAFVVWAIPAAAQPTVDNQHCATGASGPLRQTIVVVDGGVVVPDTEEGPAIENQDWRRMASDFVDAADPLVSQLIDARERVTIAIANVDGSGLTSVFTGCVPLVSEEEAKRLDAETGVVDSFFGRDWRTLNEKAAAAFARSARVAMIRGASEAVVGRPSDRTKFPLGGLISSLRNSPGFDLAEGLPRYVLLSDLGLYDIQLADAVTARANGFRDAEEAGLALGRAELHLFAEGVGAAASVGEYLSAFFLGSAGNLKTLGSRSSTLSGNDVPVKVAIYQGTALFPNIGEVPVRMRLALDRNNATVMSWIQEQRKRAQNVPFEGVLTCSASDECSYRGDDVFAQVWSHNPNPDPECLPHMPLGGMRNLTFELSGDTLSGKVTDTVCVVRGQEEQGLPFTMTRLREGRW